MGFSSDNIQLFLAVIERGSFSAAARSLGKVPSAVSMGIANLEAELGLVLFDRSRREPVPTAQAQSLVPYARMVAQQLQQLQVHALELSTGLESRLALGIAADLDRAPLVAAVKTLADRYPLLEIDVATAPQDDILAGLHAGHLDVVLAFAGLGVEVREAFQRVGSASLVAVLARDHPAVAAGRALYLEDLVQIRQILVASRERPLADTRPLVAESFWRTDSLATALDLVEAGLGWGNFPLSAIAPRLAQGRLTRIAFRNTPNELKLPVHAVWLRSNPLRKAAREFVALLGTSA
ncbi:LysR family transcriptional regulator [Pseudomonas mangiferae]|uniref:LysR family transcriptional regulator n=1 Tax=Pseudomonas mangiferae TaxID=2593654 RepID=A0A553H1S0_9PSED|nr:LysR family transcriptional regulator [Pseudomonas mangiferae]TRX75699.1 LysR family transcriptional regulator [Pseudomonas mangiferae]